MAGSVNKVIIVGNVGNQPEIRVTQISGEEIATFSLATSERWKDKNSGEQKEKTDWHRVVVFSSGLVKIIKEYVHKGSKLYIEGKLRTREYEDEAGVKRYTTEVVLTSYGGTLVLLDSKKDNTGFSGMNEGKNNNLRYDQKKELDDSDVVEDDINHDDVPF
jgi:single-strand DNA-binding protein